MKEAQLLKLVFTALRDTALGVPEPSSLAVLQAGQVGVPFAQAIIAGVATLGGLHGAVTQARVTLLAPMERIEDALAQGRRIAGFGNSTYRDQLEPACEEVSAFVGDHFPEYAQKIALVGDTLEKHVGRRLHPNVSMFTALAAEVTGQPHGTEVGILVRAGIPAWVVLYERGRQAAGG